ncbi:MAG: hypothetical protein EU532_00035 [Promethearchaeota archaeon]|nr:MAG: hypothetical protein EU532_00035 [Candidatus Lokiarchaeota archaeon]
MLRAYVYNEEKKVWLEEESLLLHDLCAILDEDDKILYLWKGPKSSSQLLDKGYKQIKDLLSNYPNVNIELITIKKKIPPNIKDKIDTMLASIETEDDIFLQFSRRSTIRLFFLMSLSIFTLSFFSLWNVVRYFSIFDWNGNVVLNPKQYETWINISKILAILSLIFFIVNVGIGIVEYEHQVIIFSAIGIIVCIGIILYLNQGIYLFLFQERSSSSFYIIAQSDINWFCIFITSALLIYLVPNCYKFIVFLRKYGEYLF